MVFSRLQQISSSSEAEDVKSRGPGLLTSSSVGSDITPSPAWHRTSLVELAGKENHPTSAVKGEPKSSKSSMLQIREFPTQSTVKNDSPDIDLGHNPSIECEQKCPDQSTSKIEPSLEPSLESTQSISLSREQEEVFNLVVRGHESVFFTGAAGTGKSVLLRHIISALRLRDKSGVAVTASTGMAACNIGGSTLHRFAGIGLGDGEVNYLIKRINRSKPCRTRWKRVKVLIIDEISMITSELFDKLDAIAKAIRKSDLPFGGLQLVVTGDFYQLPPVEKNVKDGNRSYAFLAKRWPEAITRTIHLREVFRQKDPKFIRILNEMRKGCVSEESLRFFKDRFKPPNAPEGIKPTRLFSRRDEVEHANRQSLGLITGKAMDYHATDTYLNPYCSESELNNLIAPELVTLKVGAQVMMIKNFDEDLVNGSLGTVVRFEHIAEQMPKTDHMNVPPNSTNIDDTAKVEWSEYLAESYGLQYPGKQDFETIPSAVDRRKRLRMAQLKEGLSSPVITVLPVVRFYRPDGTYREMTVHPEEWAVLDPEGKQLATRRQLPLILAWAISIHKSQGQTLDWLSVDLRSVFEVGQAYVAISRARNIHGLQVLNFRKNCVFADPTVEKFYDSLETVGRPPVQRTIHDFASTSIYFDSSGANKKTESKHLEQEETIATTPLSSTAMAEMRPAMQSPTQFLNTLESLETDSISAKVYESKFELPDSAEHTRSWVNDLGNSQGERVSDNKGAELASLRSTTKGSIASLKTLHIAKPPPSFPECISSSPVFDESVFSSCDQDEPVNHICPSSSPTSDFKFYYPCDRYDKIHGL